ELREVFGLSGQKIVAPVGLGSQDRALQVGQRLTHLERVRHARIVDYELSRALVGHESEDHNPRESSAEKRINLCLSAEFHHRPTCRGRLAYSWIQPCGNARQYPNKSIS